MKQLFTTLAIAAAFFVNAQTVTPDSSFGNSGTFLGKAATGFSYIQSTVLSDGKILYSGHYLDANNQPVSFISKINSNGTLDTSFGNNGYFSNPNLQYKYEYYIKMMEYQGKILAVYSDEGKIAMLNQNGTLATSFGYNGIISFPDYKIAREGFFIENNFAYIVRYSSLWGTKELVKLDLTNGNDIYSVSLPNEYSYNALINLPNGNMAMKYHDYDNFKSYIKLYDKNGNAINTFGTNGTLMTTSYSSSSNMEASTDFLVTDSQSNIYYINSSENPAISYIKKVLPNGTFDNSFGTNGTFTANGKVYGSVKVLNDQLYIGGGKLNSLTDIDLLLQRVNSNGTLDNTFNGNGTYIFDTNSTKEWAENINVISPTTIVAAGEILGSPNVVHVSKFVVTQNLATSEANLSQFAIENPVGNTLSYQTKEAMQQIDLYSAEGRLVKTISTNNADVSALAKGMYVAKITFKNGQTASKKIIKK